MEIRLRDVSRRVDGRRLLDGVTLSLRPGELLLLCGPNGAGKSTLLKVIAGLLAPTSGDIAYDGRPAAKWGPGLRRHLGVMLHESLLYDELTVWDNLVFAGRLFGVDGLAARADALVDEVGLRLVAREPCGRLSRGMKQRVSLARALIHRPSVLLLDEPYSGLDARWAGWLTDLLARERERGAGIVVVAHEWRLAWPLADRVAVINRGRLVMLKDAGGRSAADFEAEYRQLVIAGYEEGSG
ncbi:MAG: ABC transporter ATP-binding protein [Firmicutes bacterium]|nr:ABC transporter ATP-binding protein [Bacillota bacterium]